MVEDDKIDTDFLEESITAFEDHVSCLQHDDGIQCSTVLILVEEKNETPLGVCRRVYKTIKAVNESVEHVI